MSAMTEARLSEIDKLAKRFFTVDSITVKELIADNRRLRECIAKAPHAYRCEIGNITTPKRCTCWKHEALGDSQ